MAARRVAIVTDSAANLPQELLDAHDIRVVPMILKFGDKVSLDGVDIPPGTFYRALVHEQVPVSTAAPSIGDFRTAFEDAVRAADAVVCVTVASFVSAAHDAATAAARETGATVRVVDSKSASLGEGLPVLEAARRAADGADIDAVVAAAEDAVARTGFIATIDTFEFLRRSGRVNALFAYAGTALNIKPVFAFRGGKIEQAGRPRTRARAIERLVSEVIAASAAGPVRLGVAHADCPDDATALVTALRREVPVEGEIIVSEFTPLMGAHTGPGVLGVAYLR